MNLIELFVLAVGLSMDAFAISVCKGLAIPRITFRECALAGIWFGGFQALMPAVGYFLGKNFTEYITSVDHWITFVLLSLIGLNMVWESLSRKEEECQNASLAPQEMFVLAVATSIDALAVGITFAFLNVNILAASAFIGATTFVLSAAGVKVGAVFGARYKSRAELAGGLVLIGMGIKILVEHTLLS